MLNLRDVTKSYASGRQVLSRLSYTLEAGEYVAIMGESGVGKSTLLNLIAGLDAPDSGRIEIDGTDISTMQDDEATRLRREKFGFVFQAFHILPHLTIAQNVALPLLLNRDAPRSTHATYAARSAEDMLAAVGLAGRGRDFPRQLSGGEQQRVAIARALIHRPKLILADEPTGNLDPDTANDILKLLRDEIKQNGSSAIIVTHSHAAAASADRVLELTKHGLHPMALGSKG
ncbi:ABC transporter ATP-binding protein [Noviherbaspirillum sp. CPCC 100848]|uniref:ABC transporter ATP-binding protein n=1 Tax=Noviherbaspirillum album TaxID=3080276 RepID=A0ABU6JC04_9BURK|nr:ABC transporter ATP-binding protein [Noviherbaspirillum sp. CPCC 100848]MEC4721174.1 ABC transporter ATP-binding protein [Noviherbaspirillum sp. CPCC 100848]